MRPPKKRPPAPKEPGWRRRERKTPYNISAEVRGRNVLITVSLDDVVGISKTGRSYIIGTSRGLQQIPGLEEDRYFWSGLVLKVIPKEQRQEPQEKTSGATGPPGRPAA